ncbi:MAG: PHP-associated domain-containing protein [archaeon]|jgi:histidinol phosphatase-like PHP family hydrolase
MPKSKKNPILADMHTHLNEKKVKARDYWKFVLQKKLTVIAITEHSNYKPDEAYAKLKATQPKGILLIPGLEAKTSAGDLLLYGEDDSIYKIKELQKMNVKIETALKIATKNNLLVSFAHPFGYKSDSVCEVLGEKKTLKLLKKYKIGTEYYNGMLGSANQLLFGRGIAKRFYGVLDFVEKNKAANSLHMNRTTASQKEKLEKLAIETLNRVKKGMLFSLHASFRTVGSDAHYPTAIGSAIIELKKKPKSEKEFIEMIRTNKTLWKGPNIYSKTPVDIIGKKEMVEGLTYLAKKNVLKKRKIPIASKISQKISLGKRIKTIKRITKKANIGKISKKMPKFKIKKRFGILKQKLRNLRT